MTAWATLPLPLCLAAVRLDPAGFAGCSTLVVLLHTWSAVYTVVGILLCVVLLRFRRDVSTARVGSGGHGAAVGEAAPAASCGTSNSVADNDAASALQPVILGGPQPASVPRPGLRLEVRCWFLVMGGGGCGWKWRALAVRANRTARAFVSLLLVCVCVCVCKRVRVCVSPSLGLHNDEAGFLGGGRRSCGAGRAGGGLGARSPAAHSQPGRDTCSATTAC
jgi:hypothetical protein